MNFGIIGAGSIANAMATTIEQMSNVNMYAVASRSLEKANEYKEKYHMEKAYGSYEELVKDEDVDVVYIATPHSFHYEQIKLCLENGKHVLCEKAFTATAKQAKEVIALAEEKKLFLGEAMWTRFMPLTKKLTELLEKKVIGNVAMMTANLNFPMMHKERLIKPELAGGALLDVGIYPLTMASIVMGEDVEEVKASAVLTKEGMDMSGQYTLVYKDKMIADLNGGMCSLSDGKAIIYGDKGFIEIAGVNNLIYIKIFNTNWELIEQYDREPQITGYEYEVEACVEAIKAGKICCDEMSHDKTIKIMEIMDTIRNKMGVVYPFD